MRPPILIGQSDFEQLRLQGGLYVDKSLFVQTVLQQRAQVQLYPRPRRFGKTLSLSLLRHFLEQGPNKSKLFEDLLVWNAAGVRPHFQRYPVIALSFRGTKATSWASAEALLKGVLRMEVARLRPIWSQASVAIQEQLEAFLQRGEAAEQSIGLLSHALSQATGQQVVLLIDEYDAPLLTAWQYEKYDPGYYDQMTAWLRSLLEAGLKDNSALFRGVLTGVLRIAKESLFSGLNNVKTYSLIQQDIPEPFGFSETEVSQLLEQFARLPEQASFQRWYNGYVFGNLTVYNPWSILNALDSPRAPLQAWWLNTAENTLIRDLLLGSTRFQQELSALLNGGTIEREVEENVVLRDLTTNNLWSFLLFSGYLKAEATRWDERGHIWVTLKIPNNEVRLVWELSFQRWLEAGLGNLTPLHEALLTGDAPAVQELLETLLLRHVSTWDLKDTQDEAFYHAFTLGLLVTMESSHRVQSNREVGQGRADVQIAPKIPGRPGVILEFKKLPKGRTLEGMADEALRQTKTLKYTTELTSLGAAPIYCFGISFSGKEVVVKGSVQ